MKLDSDVGGGGSSLSCGGGSSALKSDRSTWPAAHCQPIQRPAPNSPMGSSRGRRCEREKAFTYQEFSVRSSCFLSAGSADCCTQVRAAFGSLCIHWRTVDSCALSRIS